MHLYLQLWLYGGIIAYFFTKVIKYVEDYEWGFDHWGEFVFLVFICLIVSWFIVIYIIGETIVETFDFTKPPKWL